MNPPDVPFTWPESVPRDAVPVLLTVIRERAGMRLDKFLTLEMPRLSRTRAARIVSEFAYTATARRLLPSHIVRAGETVVLFRPAWDEPEAPREVPVVHQDASLVALNKPAGLPVHPTAKYYKNTLTTILAERYPGERVALCHRLDKETSGMILAARTPAAEIALKREFAGRNVHKVYRALVHGAVERDEFVVDAPLELAGGEVSVLMRVSHGPGALASRTRVRVIERLAGFTLVEAEPETGRQHQIRVHLAHAGHAIVGDKLYAHGPECFLAALREGMTPALLETLLLPRHALHAFRITFPHPDGGHPVTFEAPFPDDLEAFAAARRAIAPRTNSVAARMDAGGRRC